MLKQNLSQRMLQRLSPQQIQLMKLLQIPTATLDQRIKEELEANPALEEGQDFDSDSDQADDTDTDAEKEEFEAEDFELDEYLTEYMEDDPGSYRTKSDYGASDDQEKTIPIAVENTFHDYLESQLGLLNHPENEDFQIALQIIGSIDDDGYLRRDPSAILDDLMFAQNIVTTEDKIREILCQIQKFDPPGVGARDLQECLEIQLKHKMLSANGHRSLVEAAMQIVKEHFEEFTKKHFNKLKKQLGINEQDLKEVIEVILKLNPKPASGYSNQSQKNSNYIVPDFIVVNRDGELELTLNSRNAPDLRINDQYRDLLQNYRINKRQKKATRKDKEAIIFIKQKIDSAKWFIDAIRKRQHTMYKTMYAILQFQYDYFLTGDQRRLKPMILKDIADLTGLDISTVSRVANSKFVQTEFGTKRLKEFFSESLQTKDGEEVSTLEVKNILTDIIGLEDKKKPYSDEKLKDMLRQKGYNIARRTVAKYREQLNIPVARLRKEL
ncbi:MAG: RNA polymerase factor sigma-54 [Saprospiraceae bacterium]|nr:RNA polymerase factor sigma-54 [Saprospiraceae bacterium]